MSSVFYWFVTAPSPSRVRASGSNSPQIIASPNDTAEFDRYSIQEYESRLFDNGEHIALIRAEFLSQRKCVQQGFLFDSYDELFVEQLVLTLYAPQHSYAVDRVMSRLIGARKISNTDSVSDQVASDNHRRGARVHRGSKVTDRRPSGRTPPLGQSDNGIAGNRLAFSNKPESTLVVRLIGNDIRL
ncbi:MAG: hypothetical protein KJO08_03905, partial [Gammaproteobacteria bacterium]|nr:hypothetical protein [Gammaproteobacteria bacterium]